MTDAAPYISITRTFDASPDDVFEAWTNPAQFGRWFGTGSTTVENVKIDLRVGGEWSARIILGGGNEIEWHGRYLEVARPYRLVLSLRDGLNRSPSISRRLRVESRCSSLSPVATCRPRGYAQAEEGWRSFFDDLSKGLSN